MLFRAVIYSTDHGINIIYPSQKGNWFSFRGRSYRKDRNAVCQVINKDNTIKGTVEALYREGYPLPRRSNLDVKEATKEHLRELISEASNKPHKSFWDALFRR